MSGDFFQSSNRAKLFRIAVWKELEHFRTEPLTLVLMILPIVLQIVLFAYAFTFEVRNIRIMVLDESRSPLSESIVETIRNCRNFVFCGYAHDPSDIRQNFERSNCRLALLIPSDFSRQLTLHQNLKLHVFSDGVDGNSSAIASGYLHHLLSDWLRRTLLHGGVSDISSASMIPDVRTKVFFNPLLRPTWYMVPALIVMLVTTVIGLLSAFSIVKEKEEGTLEQLLVTPMDPIHIISGKIVPFVLIGLVVIGFMSAVAVVWFQIPFRGSIWSFGLLSVLFLLSILGVGIAVSALVSTSQQALFLMMFMIFFFILLSGFFIPIDNMPKWAQILSQINPVRHFIFITRELFVTGASWIDMKIPCLYLLIITLISLAVSYWIFKASVRGRQ